VSNGPKYYLQLDAYGQLVDVHLLFCMIEFVPERKRQILGEALIVSGTKQSLIFM